MQLAQATGEMLHLLAETLFFFKEAPRNYQVVLRQISAIGIDTLPIAVMMAFFIGMVLALQTALELVEFGTQDRIGSIVGLSMIRELGPVMTSLLVAGRVGSAMAAEVGAMQVYEEIDALKTLEISPVRYLVMPRLIACLVAVPALVTFANLVGILGGSLVSSVNPRINVPVNVYFDYLTRSLEWADLYKGLVKSFFFGGIIALVGCYVGFKTTGGARGIGESTTRSVVMSFLLIMVANYFITRLMM